MSRPIRLIFFVNLIAIVMYTMDSIYAIEVQHAPALNRNGVLASPEIKRDYRLITRSKQAADKYIQYIKQAYIGIPFVLSCKSCKKYQCDIVVVEVPINDLVQIYFTIYGQPEKNNHHAYLDTYYDESVCNANLENPKKIVCDVRIKKELENSHPELLSTDGKEYIFIGPKN